MITPNNYLQDNFKFKSKENKDYLINLSIIENKIAIKINEIMIPLISYKISISLEEFHFLSDYFKNFKSINSIYDNLKGLIQANINNLTIKLNESSLEFIIPIQNFKNKQFSFTLLRSNNLKEEDNKEILEIIKEYKTENEKLNLKIKELKEEINQINNNILLISDQKDSLFYNLLKISPFINNITVLPSNFIIKRLNLQNMKKFKIIIYDMKDYGFQFKDNFSEIKN